MTDRPLTIAEKNRLFSLHYGRGTAEPAATDEQARYAMDRFLTANPALAAFLTRAKENPPCPDAGPTSTVS